MKRFPMHDAEIESGSRKTTRQSLRAFVVATLVALCAHTATTRAADDIALCYDKGIAVMTNGVSAPYSNGDQLRSVAKKGNYDSKVIPPGTDLSSLNLPEGTVVLIGAGPSGHCVTINKDGKAEGIIRHIDDNDRTKDILYDANTFKNSPRFREEPLQNVVNFSRELPNDDGTTRTQYPYRGQQIEVLTPPADPQAREAATSAMRDEVNRMRQKRGLPVSNTTIGDNTPPADSASSSPNNNGSNSPVDNNSSRASNQNSGVNDPGTQNSNTNDPGTQNSNDPGNQGSNANNPGAQEPAADAPAGGDTPATGPHGDPSSNSGSNTNDPSSNSGSNANDFGSNANNSNSSSGSYANDSGNNSGNNGAGTNTSTPSDADAAAPPPAVDSGPSPGDASDFNTPPAPVPPPTPTPSVPDGGGVLDQSIDPNDFNSQTDPPAKSQPSGGDPSDYRDQAQRIDNQLTRIEDETARRNAAEAARRNANARRQQEISRRNAMARQQAQAARRQQQQQQMQNLFRSLLQPNQQHQQPGHGHQY